MYSFVWILRKFCLNLKSLKLFWLNWYISANRNMLSLGDFDNLELLLTIPAINISSRLSTIYLIRHISYKPNNFLKDTKTCMRENTRKKTKISNNKIHIYFRRNIEKYVWVTPHINIGTTYMSITVKRKTKKSLYFSS